MFLFQFLLQFVNTIFRCIINGYSEMIESSKKWKPIAAWCLYDFANSPFTTLIVTFIFSPFFVMSIVGDKVEGTRLWSLAITISAIAIALISPFFGALVDQVGKRKILLFIMTAISIIGTTVLFWALPCQLDGNGEIVKAGYIYMALFWFIIANIAYELAFVLYNAFLPEIAPTGMIGRISGFGWAVGYLGGLLALFVALAGFVFTDTPWFGFTREAKENIRAINLLVALWFAVFSIPVFLFLHDKKSNLTTSRKHLMKSTVIGLKNTFHEIRKYRQIVRLLMARMFYNDGLITIFTFSGIYATGTFGFSTTEMLMLAISLNAAAGIGAFIMGFYDDRLGGKRTIQISIAGLIVAAVMAMLAPGKLWIWIAGIMAGIFSGPNQSASRSLMGRMVPEGKENEFYGFFAFSGKATAFLGPFMFGLITTLFDSQRAGIFVVVVFFIIGGLIMFWVDEAGDDKK